MRMRSPIVAALLGFALPACLVGSGDISGGGGGGDDDMMGGAVCGNSMVEAGEQCDDGNAASGDGCSSTCQTEAPQPRLDVSVDKPTISTELMTDNEVTVTLQSANGFTGAVTLAASAVDANSAPIMGWTVTLDNTSVTVPPDGTVTAKAKLSIPTQNMGLAGTLKIDVTSDLGMKSVMSEVTVANQVTYAMKVQGGACAYPPVYGRAPKADKISTGTKIRWFNTGTANFEIHVGGGANVGVSHQGQAPTGTQDPVTEPNTAYEQTVTGGGATITWYCHNPDTGTALAGTISTQP